MRKVASTPKAKVEAASAQVQLPVAAPAVLALQAHRTHRTLMHSALEAQCSATGRGRGMGRTFFRPKPCPPMRCTSYTACWEYSGPPQGGE